MYKISLQEIFTVIAEEQARKHFKQFKFLTRANNFELLREECISVRIESLYDFAGVPKPFKNYEGKVILTDRIVILADTMGIDGEYSDFYLHPVDTVSNEDFILSLTNEQREDCYVIYKGRLQPFKVLENEVFYEDMEDDLTLDEIIGTLNYLILSKKEEIKELEELIESILE